MLKYLVIICSICLLALSGSLRAEDKNNEIRMFVGEVKILPVHNVKRVAIGNGKLFSTSVLNSAELLILAEGVGDCSLVIWSENGEKTIYTVRVSQRDAGDAYRNISAMLKDISGIEVNHVGSNIIISGSTNKENLVRIAAATNVYPQAINVVREEDVSMKKMIYMKVQIVEMKRSLLENIGLQWPGSFAGPMVGFMGNLGSSYAQTTQAPLQGVLPVGVNGLRTYLGVSSLIQTTINLAKNNGDVYMLAEPELSARSGGEAKFLAGGQIPLPASSPLGGASVTFKDFGIHLSIKPVADDKGNIMASIKTEVSSVDPSVAVQGIPGFLTRQTDSEINMKDGQTLVMSGMVDSNMAKNASMIPGLGQLPVIGHLFRSDNFSSDRTDLVIMVTPTIYDPTSTINRERIDKAQDIRERFERQLSKKDIVD